MGVSKVFFNLFFCAAVLTAVPASHSQSDYKDILSSLYRKAVERNKPLVVVLDNKHSAHDRGETTGSSDEKHLHLDRGETTGSSHEKHRVDRHDSSSSESNERSSKRTNNKLIAKMLLKELDDRLRHSKITYKKNSDDNRQRQTYKEYVKNQEDELKEREHAKLNSDALIRTHHSRHSNKLKNLLDQLNDRLDREDKHDDKRDRHNRHDDHDRTDRKRERDSRYQKEKRNHKDLDRRDRHDHRNRHDTRDHHSSNRFSHLLSLLSQHDDRKDRHHDQTRLGHQTHPKDHLRSPVGKQLSALRNGLVCAAKDECVSQCYDNFRRQSSKQLDECSDECEEKYDECEEEPKKADSCGDGDDECKESSEQRGSTKGYPEEPEKYCKRC